MAPHDHGTMVCARCGSTNIIYVTNSWTETISEVARDFGRMKDDLARLPQFGWYQLFQQWPRLEERPRHVTQQLRPRRAQARACRIDRNRWKRRRFLHALRRPS